MRVIMIRGGRRRDSLWIGILGMRIGIISGGVYSSR